MISVKLEHKGKRKLYLLHSVTDQTLFSTALDAWLSMLPTQQAGYA
jgi:hypothetical protein